MSRYVTGRCAEHTPQTAECHSVLTIAAAVDIATVGCMDDAPADAAIRHQSQQQQQQQLV